MRFLLTVVTVALVAGILPAQPVTWAPSCCEPGSPCAPVASAPAPVVVARPASETHTDGAPGTVFGEIPFALERVAVSCVIDDCRLSLSPPRGTPLRI